MRSYSLRILTVHLFSGDNVTKRVNSLRLAVCVVPCGILQVRDASTTRKLPCCEVYFSLLTHDLFFVCDTTPLNDLTFDKLLFYFLVESVVSYSC